MRSLPALSTWVGLTGLLLSPPALAQEKAEAKLREGHSIHGEAFNEGPRQAGYLMLGQGAIDFPIQTRSGQVQAFFNQGVGQLHGFFYFEAERTFRQAATLEPDCPMLYWGMAMANTNNADRAKKFLAVAQEKAKTTKVSPREQLYLDALAAKYKDKANEKARMSGWLQGLEKIVQEYPDDLDARAWLALVTWENSRREGIGSRQAVSVLLDSILERHPLHPGAHHYKIHLWDGFNQAQAEASASLYAKAQPGIAHAWHMPGHTYTGLRRYSDAAYQQEGSARVDHAYMKRDRIMPFLIHNYAHNNQWLAETLTRIGQPRKAAEVARNLVEQPRDPKRNTKSNGGSSQRSGRQRWEEALVTFELWDDLIAAIESGDLDYSDIPYERMHQAYALGLARAGKGDLDGLVRQIEALKALTTVEAKPEENAGLESNRKDAPTNVDPSTGKADEKPEQGKDEDGKKVEEAAKEKEATSAPKSEEDKEQEEGKEAGEDEKEEPKKPTRIPGLESALAELEGQLHLLRGEHETAFERFKKAGSMRREGLARAYKAAGKFEEALAKAREAVERAPGEVSPQATLVEMLSAAGQTEEARKAYVDLQSLAREAESGLPVLDRVGAIVESWKMADGWTPAPLAPRTDRAFANRVDLESLGPLNWEPTDCPDFSLTDHEGRSHTLSDYRGKNLVLIFFLGGQCAHCMQQLVIFSEQLDALRAEGTEVLAIGTDSPEVTKALRANPEVKIAMPLVADPGLEVFRRFRAHDDFEGSPLHSTVLIDAEGKIRYQDTAPEPFFDVDFIKEESARIKRIVGPKSEAPRAVAQPSTVGVGAAGAGR